METILEVVLEVLGEFLFEVVLQLVFELGVRALLAPVRASLAASMRWPWLTVFGAVAGGASLVVAPHAFLASPAFRLANLLVSPLVAGAAMAALGALRVRRGQVLLPFDRFVSGFAFAFAFAAVRWAFAT